MSLSIAIVSWSTEHRHKSTDSLFAQYPALLLSHSHEQDSSLQGGRCDTTTFRYPCLYRLPFVNLNPGDVENVTDFTLFQAVRLSLGFGLNSYSITSLAQAVCV